jgi:hypothetical protein
LYNRPFRLHSLKMEEGEAAAAAAAAALGPGRAACRRQEQAFLEGRSARSAAGAQSGGSGSGSSSGEEKPADAFWRVFRERQDEVGRELEDLRATKARAEAAPLSSSGRLDDAVGKVMALQKDAADASIHLPPYDSRRAAEEIAKMLESIELAREELAPRKKFSFSARRWATVQHCRHSVTVNH